MGDVNAIDIASYLQSKLVGNNITLFGATSLNSLKQDTLSFSKNESLDVDVNCLLLVPLDFENNKDNFSFIKVKNPRLSFAKVVQKFFVKEIQFNIDKTVKIGFNSNIHKKVKIGVNSIIGDNITIGKNTVINNNVIIYDNTVIGNNCYIKSGSVIGEDGFGFDFEEDGTPIRIPHIGSVTIGNHVEIGANTVIARGTLDNTILENYVKVDDHSIIAHNCQVGEKTIITGQVAISGSVKIGKQCWIGPNCTLMQKIKIGNNVTIGMGCTVNNNVKDNEVYMELPSMNIEKASLYRNAVYRIIKDYKNKYSKMQ